MALETMSAAQARLADMGFGQQLVVDDSGLRVAGSEQHFDPTELAVVETVRFEGETDPADEAILFALTSRAGEPVGTYVAAYGPNVGPMEARVIERLHDEPLSEEDIRAHR